MAEIRILVVDKIVFDVEIKGSGAPALRILLRCRHHLPLQPPGLPPVVEGDYVNAQLG